MGYISDMHISVFCFTPMLLALAAHISCQNYTVQVNETSGNLGDAFRILAVYSTLGYCKPSPILNAQAIETDACSLSRGWFETESGEMTVMTSLTGYEGFYTASIIGRVAFLAPFMDIPCDDG
ncbi:hypothetical protein V1507DRAFT_452383 [Lipomyces tetrasporus]